VPVRVPPGEDLLDGRLRDDQDIREPAAEIREPKLEAGEQEREDRERGDPPP
jgi:hypothetical protein